MKKVKTGFTDLLAKSPSSPEEQQAYIQELRTAVTDLAAEVHNLDEIIALLRKKQFGSSSERTPYEETEQLELGNFNEGEAAAKEEVLEPAKKDKRGLHIRKPDGKWKLEKLPVKEVQLTLNAGQLVCEKCGTQMVPIGKEVVRESLQFIPASVCVLRYIRTVYGCPQCKKSGNANIMKTVVPPPLLNHSMASASSVAEVMYQKYVNAVPLYRQEKDWAERGVGLTRGTMANWMIRCAEDWLYPVTEQLRRQMLQREVLHCDETPVQVLKEPGKAATSKSYMWLYRTGADGLPPIVLYDYRPDRKGENAVRYLEGFHGYLHTDGYAGYDQVNGVTRCGCWAHVRRKFVEAIPTNLSGKVKSSAQIGRDYCDRLFATEKQLAGLLPQEKRTMRTELEAPQLQAFWSWLNTVDALPGSSLGKAVQYAKKQRPVLENYLLDGRCSISNNLAENAIRPFTVGRKNWLFSDTPAGATSSAAIYSLVETAKANGWNVRNYLTFLLEQLPRLNFRMHPERLDMVMPWSGFAKAAAKQFE